MSAPAAVDAPAETPDVEAQQVEKQAKCNACRTPLGAEDVKPDPLGAFDLDRHPVCKNTAECVDRMIGGSRAKKERARRAAEGSADSASESPAPASPGAGNKPAARKRTRQRTAARTGTAKAKPAPKEEAAS